MGNSRARAVYEANLPEDFRRPQTESSLETFIRAKYEKKKYIAKEWVPSKPPDFPEGWTKLIEAEKQKKDIKQIRLPSHTLPPPPEPSTQASSSSNIPLHDLLALNTPANASLNTLVSTQQQANPSSNVDLIGIVDSVPQDNSFDAFAPSGNNDNTSSSSNDLKKSEDDFFTTPVTSNKSNSDKKMSNDSIMALFSQSGNTNNNAFRQSSEILCQISIINNRKTSTMIRTFGSSQPGFNMVPNNTNPVSPFMATGSMSNPLGPQDTGANKVLNQFNGLNLGASSNGSNGIGNLLPNPLLLLLQKLILWIFWICGPDFKQRVADAMMLHLDYQ
ncbi:SMAP [Lepeophtheirus salmonis]|uniref:SMAP n=1 Tax=Lepeophtheirus salmonis TaxID=72036 RepID=A0A7R8CS67_LEPSM|nr:SMAP [Lepeophtheirus salmonis]CAF2861857.1 SMAP [Lepeophtheirus salmonis]